MAKKGDSQKKVRPILVHRRIGSFRKTKPNLFTVPEEEEEVVRSSSRQNVSGKSRACYRGDEEAGLHAGCSMAAQPLNWGSHNETTPLIQGDTNADANGGNQSSCSHLKIICSNYLHVFNIIALSIILFGGVVVSLWLYFDRTGNTDHCGESCTLHLTTRHDWGAEPPRTNLSNGARPAAYVVISHTATSPCNSTVACKSELKAMQLNNFQRNFSDIKYSFLIGGNGFTYEGRGWDAESAIASHFDAASLEIAFIGNFDSVTPPEEQLNQAKALIQEALYQHKLSHDYKLVAHRQVAHTNSPGSMLYSIIKTWKHWENCYMQYC